MSHYHKTCWEALTPSEQAEDTEPPEFIPDDDVECDEGGWCLKCECCLEPSYLAQAKDAETHAYWEAYFTPGMRARCREQAELSEASDADLDALSRDCGKRITRP